MTDLIACLSTGKGSWGTVSRLISAEKWDKVYLITNEFGREKFTPDSKTELICLDLDKDALVLRDQIINALKDKITGVEVAVNVCSGAGKEHMALLSAVLKLGVGVRFVDYCNDSVVEL